MSCKFFALEESRTCSSDSKRTARLDIGWTSWDG